MEIPWEQLAPDALLAVLEEFATRDGTDLEDASLKVARLREQLRRGRLKIWFDEETETCQILEVGNG